MQHVSCSFCACVTALIWDTLRLLAHAALWGPADIWGYPLGFQSDGSFPACYQLQDPGLILSVLICLKCCSEVSSRVDLVKKMKLPGIKQHSSGFGCCLAVALQGTSLEIQHPSALLHSNNPQSAELKCGFNSKMQQRMDLPLSFPTCTASAEIYSQHTAPQSKNSCSKQEGTSLTMRNSPSSAHRPICQHSFHALG